MSQAAAPIRRSQSRSIHRRPLALVALAALAASLCAPRAIAQEVQVPLDRAGRIERIDAPLARRLGTLTERYPGFTEARLFRAPDSTFTFEVTMKRGGQTVRERFPMSAASADSLRDWVSLLVTEKAPQAGLHQEGRPVLITGTTLLGLGFYGWAVPYAGHVEDGGVATGLYLLTAAGSFFIPFALTADQDVTYGMADLTLYGTTRGIVHGILAYQLFAGSDNTSQGNVGSAAAGSLIEGVGGYLWAQRAHLTAGAVQTVGTLGDFGLLEGLGFASLADDYDNDRNSAAAAKMLAGSAAGLAGGAVLAQHRDFSYGDAAVMRDAGLLGVLGADMVADWFNPSDHQAYVGAAMAGGALGLAAGDRLVARTDFNVGQSVLVTLGMVAGGMVGLGISAIGLNEGGDHSTFALTASMAGATLGFAATYASLLPQARSGSADHSSWRIELSPVAALAGARRPGPSRNAVADAPLVRVSCRF